MWNLKLVFVVCYQYIHLTNAASNIFNQIAINKIPKQEPIKTIETNAGERCVSVCVCIMKNANRFLSRKSCQRASNAFYTIRSLNGWNLKHIQIAERQHSTPTSHSTSLIASITTTVAPQRMAYMRSTYPQDRSMSSVE